MKEKKRVSLLIAIMAVSTLSVTCIAIALLSRTAIQQQRERLVESVQSEARMIEAIARNVARQHPDLNIHKVLETTVNQVTEVHKNYQKGGRSTEFTLARRMGNLIVFLIRHRHDHPKTSTIVKWGVGLAEPMQLALSGKSGTVFGRDYRGVRVLAAYEPVAGLNLGIVAKIDVSELREPLINAGAVSLVVAFLVVIAGVALFQRITGPMVDQLQERAGRLAEINDTLIQEVSDRQKAEKALLDKTSELELLNEGLENRILERTAEINQANRRLRQEAQDRETAQKELSKSKARLQAVFDGISDPLILLDKGMTLLMLNTAAVRYYGINSNSEAVEGKSCIAAVGHPRACQGCVIPEAVMGGKRIAYERQGLMDPRRLERVVVYPLQGEREDASKAVIHVIDITEAKQIENQMIQSEKLSSLGMLVSSIAHEINNPNNFISFNIPILKDYIREILPFLDVQAEKNPGLELCNMAYPEFRQDIMKLVDNIDHGASRISVFIRNLREFSQFRDQRRKEWIDPGESVARALAICNNKIKNSVQSFIHDVPDDLPRIFSDPHALEQILINLLVNSAQASDKKDSWVKLKITVTESWLEHTVIEVSDNGRGVDPDYLERIFDPFFTTKAGAEGTGLGLYVCRSLVEALGGRLEVESELGVGCKFTVFLNDKERREKPRS